MFGCLHDSTLSYQRVLEVHSQWLRDLWFLATGVLSLITFYYLMTIAIMIRIASPWYCRGLIHGGTCPLPSHRRCPYPFVRRKMFTRWNTNVIVAASVCGITEGCVIVSTDSSHKDRADIMYVMWCSLQLTTVQGILTCPTVMCILHQIYLLCLQT